MDAVNGRCPERTNLAAFLCGAMGAQEHDAFSAHVGGCADCQHDLSELAPLPPMLDRIRDTDLDEVDVPEGLRAGVLAAVERASVLAAVEPASVLATVERVGIAGSADQSDSARDGGSRALPPTHSGGGDRASLPPVEVAGLALAGVRRGRSRRRVLALAAAVLALLAAVTGGLRLRGVPAPGERIALRALTPADHVVATAKVRSDANGTTAELVVRNSIPDAVYGVWFEDQAGKRISLGSFRGRGGEIRFRGQTAVRRADIRAVGAWSNGGDVARADFPAKKN